MFTRLKNRIWLYKVNKNIKLLEDENSKWFSLIKKVQNIISFYSFSRKKSKYKTERNLVASIARQVRKLHPYKPTGITEAQTLYEDYFTLENHIESFNDLKKGMYLKRFRNNYPEKGEKYSEYHLNFDSGDLGVYKITEKSEYGSWKLTNIRNDYWCESIKDSEITAFLYATEKEIQSFKSREIKYREMKKEIDMKFKEVGKLQQKAKKI